MSCPVHKTYGNVSSSGNDTICHFLGVQIKHLLLFDTRMSLLPIWHFSMSCLIACTGCPKSLQTLSLQIFCKILACFVLIIFWILLSKNPFRFGWHQKSMFYRNNHHRSMWWLNLQHHHSLDTWIELTSDLAIDPQIIRARFQSYKVSSTEFVQENYQ